MNQNVTVVYCIQSCTSCITALTVDLVTYMYTCTKIPAISDNKFGTASKFSPPHTYNVDNRVNFSLLLEKTRYFPTLIRGDGENVIQLKCPNYFWPGLYICIMCNVHVLVSLGSKRYWKNEELFPHTDHEKIGAKAKAIDEAGAGRASVSSTPESVGFCSRPNVCSSSGPLFYTATC